MSPDEVRSVTRDTDVARRELTACRDDLGEAYLMLAKAGLDWAQERQAKALVETQMLELTALFQSQGEELTSARRQLQQIRESLEEHLSEVARSVEEERRQNEGLRTRCARLETQNEELLRELELQRLRASEGTEQFQGRQCPSREALERQLIQERGQREALERQCEEAAEQVSHTLQAQGEALARERQGREAAEGMAASLLKMLLEARQEEERERQMRVTAEQATVAVLQWAAQELQALQSEQGRLEQERREMELSGSWREYNVRVKLHQAQEEMLERCHQLEALEEAMAAAAKLKGLTSLWGEAQGSTVKQVLEQLRQPLVPDCELSPEVLTSSAGPEWSRTAAAAAEEGFCAGATVRSGADRSQQIKDHAVPSGDRSDADELSCAHLFPPLEVESSAWGHSAEAHSYSGHLQCTMEPSSLALPLGLSSLPKRVLSESEGSASTCKPSSEVHTGTAPKRSKRREMDMPLLPMLRISVPGKDNCGTGGSSGAVQAASAYKEDTCSQATQSNPGSAVHSDSPNLAGDTVTSEDDPHFCTVASSGGFTVDRGSSPQNEATLLGCGRHEVSGLEFKHRKAEACERRWIYST